MIKVEDIDEDKFCEMLERVFKDNQQHIIYKFEYENDIKKSISMGSNIKHFYFDKYICKGISLSSSCIPPRFTNNGEAKFFYNLEINGKTIVMEYSLLERFYNSAKESLEEYKKKQLEQEIKHKKELDTEKFKKDNASAIEYVLSLCDKEKTNDKI